MARSERANVTSRSAVVPSRNETSAGGPVTHRRLSLRGWLARYGPVVPVGGPAGVVPVFCWVPVGSGIPWTCTGSVAWSGWVAGSVGALLPPFESCLVCAGGGLSVNVPLLSAGSLGIGSAG